MVSLNLQIGIKYILLALIFLGVTDDIDRQLVEISMKLGEMAISMRNNEQAVNYYKEGLTVSPNNVSILVALAKIYMQVTFGK